MVSVLASDVDAQESGGSFGGSDWSDDSSGSSGGSDWGSSGSSDWGSSGSNDWGSSDSSDWGSSDGGGVGPGADAGGAGCCCGVVGFLLIAALVIFFVMRSRRGGGGGGGGASAGRMPGGIRVAALSLGLDWRARKDIQALLEHLAKTGNMQTAEGRAHALREVTVALRRAELSWLYVAPAPVDALAKSDAQRAFTEKASAYRSRFRRELVRNEQGDVRTADAPAMQARPDEGQGTVVVTIVVAAKRPLSPIEAPDASNVRQALSALGTLQANELIALEVIWSPATENDRMSTAELEQNYPEMRLIDPNSIAGRIFCAYCSGPFPMELLKCPHCGAPATDSQANRAPPRSP